MPYLVISSRTVEKQEVKGPTYFGHATLPEKIVGELHGHVVQPSDDGSFENNSDGSDVSSSDSLKDEEMGKCYRTELSPSLVMDKMEGLGYKLLSCAVGSKKVIWTLYKKAPAVRSTTNGRKKTTAGGSGVGSGSGGNGGSGVGGVDEVETDFRGLNVKAKTASAKGSKAAAAKPSAKKPPVKGKVQPVMVVDEVASSEEDVGMSASGSASEDEGDRSLEPPSAGYKEASKKVMPGKTK